MPIFHKQPASVPLDFHKSKVFFLRIEWAITARKKTLLTMGSRRVTLPMNASRQILLNEGYINGFPL